jgi:hypothetical protein
MNVFPIQAPPQGAAAKCLSCGAAMVADQRYCLTCGQPCSPVRLAFLDVMQGESEQRAPVTIMAPPAGYLPPLEQDGAIGWLRRYSGLFGLLAVLLTTGLIGLLLGHWLSPSKAVGPQVIKIEGGTLPVAGAGASTSSTAAPSTRKATTTRTSDGEAQEVKEVKEAESPKAKLKAPAKTNASSLDKLEKLTGKQHQKAIEKLTEGGKPIETGG